MRSLLKMHHIGTTSLTSEIILCGMGCVWKIFIMLQPLVENMVFCDIVQNDKKCPM